MTGVYLTMSMAETSMSVMLTILVLRLHHAGPDQAAMWPMVPTRPPCRRRSRSGRGVPTRPRCHRRSRPGRGDAGGPGQAAVSPLVRRVVLCWLARLVGGVHGPHRPRRADIASSHIIRDKLTPDSPGQIVVVQS